MEKLIQQLANKKSAENGQQALGLALKEVVLSGLSRGGFLKESYYLPGLDTFENGTFCLCFLNQNDEGFSPLKKFLPFLKNELTAFGVDCRINDLDTGFSVEYENIRLITFIYHKDFKFKPEYAYQQVPVAYELRVIRSMKEGVRNEIYSAMNSAIFNTPAAPKKKKGTAKGSSKSKEKQQPEHWVQPSLFDF